MTKSLLGILLIAFLLRAGLACGLQYRLDHHWNRSFLIEGDANGYWELGSNLAKGEPYEIYDPPRKILRMPGFPLFLAATMKVSNSSYLFARIALAIIGTLCCCIVYFLGKELFNQPVGLIAAFWCAITPVYAGFSVLLLSETLFTFVMLFNLWLSSVLCRKIKNDHYSYHLSVGSGILIAIGTLIRPSWLLATPILIFFILLISSQKKKGLISAILIVAGCTFTLAPWVIRNHQVSGHWVITSLWSGPSLYDGLHPGADGSSNMQFFEDDQLLNRMSEYEMNQYYQTKAIAFAKENPGRTFNLAMMKLGRFWSLWPNAEQFQNPLIKAALIAFFTPLAIFSIAGIYQYRKQGLILLITVGPIVYFSMIHLLFIGSLRYRLPAEFPLSVLSAASFFTIWKSWKSTQLTTTESHKT